MSNDFVIKTTNLTKRYKQFNAVTDLNLRVPTKCVYAFLGPNGAGKTTTMKMLLGLVRPTDGKITILGKKPEKNYIQIRHQLGYLPQNPAFLPHLTVNEIMDYVADLFSVESKQKRINELLDMVGLSGKENRRSQFLSGGEKQRLGLAQAMINSPKLLILDEPAAALDPAGRKRVLEIIENAAKTSTVFYSTHILADVKRVSDQVAIIHEGKLITEESISSLENSRGSQASYILKGEGNPEGLISKLKSVQKINAVNNSIYAGEFLMKIYVTDREWAKKELFKLISNKMENEPVTLYHYQPKSTELEDIFLDLTAEKK